MKILGIIPARGGSKSIPRKNIRKLAGRPLIEYTIEVALACSLLNRTIVSTDIKELLKLREIAMPKCLLFDRLN